MNSIFKKKFSYFFISLSIIIYFACNAYGYKLENRKTKVMRKELPKYCICAGWEPGVSDHPLRPKYDKLYGPIFAHMHHYCYGLDKFNDAIKRTPSRLYRDRLLRSAIMEFNYVISKKDPKKSIKHEVYFMKGQILFLLGDNINALRSIYSAIKFNKKYIKAYLVLSSYHLNHNDVESACKILKVGYKNSPESGYLKSKIEGVCNSRK